MRTLQALPAILLSTTILAGAPALAQATAASSDSADAEEIIVTAQKREENLQDVPISVQALSTRKLDQLNATNFERFAALLPSVSFETSQPGSTNVYMRGVASGGDGNHSGPLPSVGFYLDEQPVTTIGGTIDIHIYDIARIESLAGPQGTLYGASSQAGTIRIITNKPSTAGFEGRIDGEINTIKHGEPGGKLEGMVNLPVNDSTALRIVGWYENKGGYIDNVPGTRRFLPTVGGISVNNTAFVESDFNDLELYGARAALKIDLNDEWTVTPTLNYQHQQTSGVFGFQPSVGDLKVQRFYPDASKDRFVQAAMTIEGKIGSWDLTYAGAYMSRKIDSTGDYTDYAEAYDSLYASVGGVAGYFYFTDNAGRTIDSRQFTTSAPRYKKLSQELRIASPQDSAIRFVGGLFYQRQVNDIDERYNVPNLASAMSVNGLPGILWLTKQKRVDRDYAAFGELTYDISDTLSLTAGGRVFKFDNSLVGFFGFGRNPAGPPFNAAGSSRTGVAGCFTTTGQIRRDNATAALLPAVVAGGPCTNLGTFVNGTVVPKDQKGDGFIHRLNLNWKPTEDVLLYTTWSRGFRPGGINRRGTVPPYKADYLTNYEVGWKTTLADGRLRFNGAAYRQNWSNFQFAFLGLNSFTQIENGPDARIWGIESDINWTPADGLSLSGGLAYTDAKIKENLCASNSAAGCATTAALAPKGTRLPITPKFKGNLTARYQFPLGDTDAHIQAAVYHSGSASSDIRINDAATVGRLKAYTYADFAVGTEWQDYSLELFVSNLFDTRAQLSRGVACSVCTRSYVNVVTPQTIGLRAGAKF
jgi:outer membrane receptor protein involved in Fe transport